MNQKPGPKLNKSQIPFAILILGFLLIISAQYLMVNHPMDFNRLPPLLFLLNLVGTLLIIVSYILRTKTKNSSLKVDQRGFHPGYWIGISILLIVLPVFSQLFFIKKDIQNYDFVLISWLCAGACFIFAFKESFPSYSRVKEWIKTNRGELFFLGGLMLLAAILRFVRLGDLPRVIDGDEGLLGLFAQSSDTGVYTNPFALWENFGGIYLQVVHVMIRFFGASPLAIRILPAISGILAIPALYLFARQVAGRRIAFISAFLLAVSHAHVHFSRIGSVGYIHGTWLVPLELFLLLAGLEKRKLWMTAAAGVLLAIHFSVYLTAQVIIGMVFVFTLILVIFFMKWLKETWRLVVAFWGGFAIMILPQLTYITRNTQEFLSRLNNDGTFQSGWMAQTMASTGQSVFRVLAGRVSHAFFSLIYYPAQDFYGSNFSILSNISAILFLVGLGIAILDIKKRGMLLLNGYFWAPTLAIGIFSIPPSADSYRMLMVLPPAILMVALGIDRILELIRISFKNQKLSYVFITSCLLLSIAAINIWAYFGDFVGQCRYSGDLTSRFASYLGSYTKTLNYGTPVFLLSDNTFSYGTHASTDFLSGGRKVNNVPEELATWDTNPGEVIIASPSRIVELENWMLTHPGGKRDYIFDCKNLILLAYTVH